MDQLDEALPDPIGLVCGQKVIRVPQGAAFSCRSLVGWDGVPLGNRTISSSRRTRLEIGTRKMIVDIEEKA